MSEEEPVKSLDERLDEARDLKALNAMWREACKRKPAMTVMLNIGNLPRGADGEVHIPRIEDWKDDWCKYYIEQGDLERLPHLARLLARQRDDFIFNPTMGVWIFQPRLANTMGDVPPNVTVNQENPHP